MKVKGTLVDGNREFTHPVAIVNPKLMYFFDNGADTSEYYDTISQVLGTKLKNTVPDGAYTEENGAGYLGVSEKDDKDNFDLGLYAGDDYLSNGWWAESGKNIEYAFYLEPGTYTVSAGFQEWWNTGRPCKLTVKSGDQKLGEKAFTVDRSSTDLQVNQTFEVTKETAGKVVVSVSKTGNPDPVMSWIALVCESKTEVPETDKTALSDKINEVRSISTDGYTVEFVEAYREAVAPALAEAEAVLENASASQDEADRAAAMLQETFESAKKLLVTIESITSALTQGMEEVQKSVKEENCYTAESWAVYQEALRNVQDVLSDANITKTEADTALAHLRSAAQALVEKQSLVDKTRLQTWIKKVEDVLGSGQVFTSESRKAAEDALAAGKAVNENVDADVAQVDQAWRDLMNAFLGLENGVEKNGLGQAIALAQQLLADPETEKNYTAKSVQKVKDKLAAAELVYADQEADQETVNSASNELIDAVTQLLEKDFGYLIDLIRQARELLENADRYTPSSVKKLEEAVTAAEKLVEDKAGDTAEIDSAYDDILTAIAELQLRGNKAELKSVLEKAGEILGQPGRYLESTLEGLQEAYDSAKAVYDDGDADQNRITEAVIALLKECMEVRILGDVDMNGIVDNEDSRLMLQYSAELTDLTKEQELAGDVNKDGQTDTADASRVLELTSGKIQEL